jgi:hypothetical protein
MKETETPFKNVKKYKYLDILLKNHKCINDEKTNKIIIWLRTRNYWGYRESVDFSVVLVPEPQ